MSYDTGRELALTTLHKKRVVFGFILVSLVLAVSLSAGFTSMVSASPIPGDRLAFPESLKGIINIPSTLLNATGSDLVGPAKPDEQLSVIVGFKEVSDVTSIMWRRGEVKGVYLSIKAVAATVPSSEIDILRADPNVAYVEEDSPVYALAQPVQWGVTKISAPTVWAGGDKGAGIKVAVLDTGIATSHPDLRVVGGATFVRGTTSYNDDNGHGSHCAGIIAALDNDIGVVGVAPEASLYAVKVLDRRGSGSISNIISGMEWCIANGIQVISMSFGSSSDSTALRAECTKAYNAGIVLVAAAGNSGPGSNTVLYPARYSTVISVAATDSYDAVASWSSRGPQVSVAAPGVSIYSTYKGNAYATVSGTSMACPHASGTVALVLEKAAHTPAEVKTILQTTAVDLGTAGFDTSYGYGRINAAAAVGGTAPPTPDFSISASPSSLTLQRGASGSSVVTVSSVNGFSGTVDLTASAPSGWSVTANPVSISGGTGSSTVTINVPSSASTGTNTVTITGTSSSLSHSATVTVNVQAPAAVSSAPQNLQATAGNAQVTLSWSAPSSNGGASITNYNIYRGTSSGSETLLTTVGNVLSYTDNNAVANGQIYFYRVTAVNSAGESPTSNEVSATPTGSQLKTMNVAVRATRSTSRTYATITTTVTDSSTGRGLRSATVAIKIYSPSNTLLTTYYGRTDTIGTLKYVYHGPLLPSGTYTAIATVTLTGYQTGTGQTTF